MARGIGCALLALVLVLGILTAAATWVAGILLGVIDPSLRAPLPVTFGVLVLVILGFAFSGRLFGRTARSIGSLAEAAERLADGEADVRVPVRGPGPYRRLAIGFNAMAERIDRSRAQQRALLAEVTHELRTPLTIVSGGLEAMLDGVRPRDDATLRPLLDESRVMARLIEDLRTLSFTETGSLPLHREPTDLGSLARDVADAHRPAAAEAGVALEVEAGIGPVLEVDPVRIREVMANLVANAVGHTPPGGRVLVRVSDDRIGAILRVDDTGAGIAPEELPLVFERFYRGAGSRGSGLGLTIARDLVTAHGGTIDASSDGPGQGTIVTIRLPRRD